jgi:hypothetical protein
LTDSPYVFAGVAKPGPRRRSRKPLVTTPQEFKSPPQRNFLFFPGETCNCLKKRFELLNTGKNHLGKILNREEFFIFIEEQK